MKPSDLYTVSIAYDWRLYKQDIAGSMAHVKMLGKQNIISMEDVQTICMGLSKIETEIDASLERDEIILFIQNSVRGIMKGYKQK